MLTSAQICTMACQAAKVPGFTAQAGQFLNARLVQIALNQDMDIVKRYYTFTAQIGQTAPYPMPVNYSRARQVFYYNNGVSYDLDQRSIEDYNKLFQGPGLDDYPYLFATDVSGAMSGNPGTPQLYLYPQPVVQLQIEVLYFDTTVEIVTPETSQVIPWYPDQLALIYEITNHLMLLSDDTRKDAVEASTRNMMQAYLQLDNDKEQRTNRVKLDTLNFRTARRSIRPTKLQGD
jgi:hypothetical protein